MKYITTIIFCFQIFLLDAQNKVELSGTVIALNTNQVIENTAITIFDTQTNALIDYAYSNEKGKFKILITKDKNIYIKADILGYEDYKSASFTISKNTTHDIRLKESSEELEEVVIFQKKKLIKLSGDKLIYDVELSGIGEGNDGLETISKLPGMRLDKDEKIVFRGSTNLQIMINGKKSLLSGDALTQYLKTVGGENIKKIEIISNPSARYDASGTAGIVNIQLKKAINIGLTGSLNSSIGGDYFRNSNGANLYYQKGKWNLNFTGRYAHFNSVNNREIIRKITNVSTINTFEQLNDWYPKSKSVSGKIGIEYSIDKNQIIGTSINYNVYNTDAETVGKTNEFENSILKKYTLLNELDAEKEKTVTGNIYYNYMSDSLDTKLNIEFNYAGYNNTKNEITRNQYFLTDNTKYQNDFTIQLNSPTNYKIMNSKIDLEKKISKNHTLETGLKYSYVNNDYDNQYAIKNLNAVFVPNPQRSNHLLYKESILSGYGMLAWNFEKWNIQTGLRVEHINFTATSLTNNNSNKKRYTSWFPSFSVNRILENTKIQFSYSRRIQRPNYLDLNPFYEYLDTYNVAVGNPNLQPQFTNAVNIAWIYKQKTSLSLYTNFSSDVIYYKVDYNPTENITINSQDNIATSTNVGLSYATSIKAKNWWTISLNSNLSYTRMTSDIEDYKFDDAGYNWYINATNEFTFKNNWKAFFEAFYNLGGVYGNWNNKPSYDISFRVRKSFYDSKWKFQLKGDNLLKKSLFSSVITQKNVETNWVNKWETRRVSFSITYRFGDGKKKSIKVANLQDEKNRL